METDIKATNLWNDVIVSGGTDLADLLEAESGDDKLYPVIHLSGPGIELAFTNRAKNAEASCHSFVNGIKSEGGIHVDAMKDALVKVMGDTFCNVDICPSQILQGLSAVKATIPVILNQQEFLRTDLKSMTSYVSFFQQNCHCISRGTLKYSGS